MKFKLTYKGDYSKTKKYLKRMSDIIDMDYIKKVCEHTVIELQRASPNEQIARGWSYTIITNKKGLTIYFNNSYVVDGTNMVLIVNSGHATRGGNWISGKHFVEKPTQEAYEKILRHMWEEIQSV